MTTNPTQPHICTADGGLACPGHTPPPLPPEPDPGLYLIGEFFALRRDGAVVVERWLSISIVEGGHRWSSWEDLAREAGCPDVPIRRLVPAPEPVTLPWHLSSINGRCSSCDHLDTQHGPEGCWYTVTAGREGANLVCPCTVTAPTGRWGVCGHPIYSSGLCDAPETARRAPQSDDQAQVRGESHTEASAGADGPWSDAWCRTQLQRLSIAASERYGLRWRDYDVVAAVIAEIDRLRAERDRLRRRLGDVLDLEELLEDHIIMAAVRRLRAAVRRLRAARSATPDTRRTVKETP